MLGGSGLHRLGLGDVKYVNSTAALFVQRFECGSIDVGRNDARALLHKRQGSGASNALPCGGDECGFSS